MWSPSVLRSKRWAPWCVLPKNNNKIFAFIIQCLMVLMKRLSGVIFFHFARTTCLGEKTLTPGTPRSDFRLSLLCNFVWLSAMIIHNSWLCSGITAAGAQGTQCGAKVEPMSLTCKTPYSLHCLIRPSWVTLDLHLTLLISWGRTQYFFFICKSSYSFIYHILSLFLLFGISIFYASCFSSIYHVFLHFERKAGI